MATMAGDTATIRVTRTTRDLLAEQARERGMSLAALLGEIARTREAEAIWRSERDASRADAQRAEVAEEEGAWEAALADGLG
jgi:hypothetical protein